MSPKNTTLFTLSLLILALLSQVEAATQILRDKIRFGDNASTFNINEMLSMRSDVIEEQTSKQQKLEAAIAYTYTIASGKIEIAPAFVTEPLTGQAQIIDSEIKYFIGTTGLNADTLAKNSTTCENRIVEIKTIYVPRVMYKITALLNL